MKQSNEKNKKTVNLLTYKIKNFDKDWLMTEEGNIEYNKLIVKKAVLAKKLEASQKFSLRSFIQKFIRKAKGKTLICDRF